jgi:AcrR family transcriptional regulator
MEDFMPTQTFYNLTEDKQNHLWNAIIRELGTHTYEHVNLANIIRDANISRGSFYQYFKDKDDMFDYFYARIVEVKMSFFKSLFDPSRDIAFLDRIEAIYIQGIAFRKAYPEYVEPGKRILESHVIRQKDSYLKGVKQAIDLYASFIVNDQKKGRIDSAIDARLLARMVMELLNSEMIESYLEKDVDEQAIKDRLKMIKNIFRKGIT